MFGILSDILSLAHLQHWYGSAVFFIPLLLVTVYVWFSGRRGS